MVSKNLMVVANALNKPVEEMAEVATVYPFALTPFLTSRVEEGTYSPQALLQFAPDLQELQIVEDFYPDPTNEGNIKPEQAILRTYHNRLLITLTHQCLVYCRYCFRKALVGFPEHTIAPKYLEQALAYVSAHSEIEDVVLSGGDPLAVPNRQLIPFLQKLTAISHLKAIRLDSRALSSHPARIDQELIDFLQTDERFWFYAQFNHPDDIDHPAVISAIRRLLSARVPLFNQCVILHGVNDDPEVMARLMMLCYQYKVIPYNMYILDHVAGAAHFDVPAEKIIEICQVLSHLPGPAQPVLIYVDEHSRKHRAVYDSIDDLHAFLGRREAYLTRKAATVALAAQPI